MKTRFLILFLLVLLFSSAIRFFYLTQNPDGFDQTEAAFAYNAYSVLTTGKDEHGVAFPLILLSFGDYKLSGYIFWQIPFIALLGLNVFSARLTTAVAGVISLLLIYYIVYAIFKNKKLALLTFFFTSIAPWHIVLSRMAYDPMIALMLGLFSISFFINWYKTERTYLLLLSALTLCWSILTYYAVWVILPLMMIIYGIFVYKKSKTKTKKLLDFVILVLPLLMVAKLLLVTQGQRLHQDSTYQVHAYPVLLEQIREDQGKFPLLVTRIFHNKLVFYPQFLLRNLFNNLSFDFLFLTGDKIDRRFYVPHQGVLYLWTAPFVILGILYFWKNHSLYKNLLLLGSILLIFLGSAFSEFGSETERTLFAVPIFCFLTSYGLLMLYHTIRRYPVNITTIFISGIGLLLSFNVAYFNHQYYWHANVHEPWRRDYGMSQMLSLLPTLESKYEQVIIPDNAYIFYYFFNKTDPATVWVESASRLDQKNYLGLELPAQVGNYLTMPIDCPNTGKLDVLYVCKGSKIPKNSRIIEIIRYRDEQPAFILLEFIPTESTDPPPKHVSYTNDYGLIDDEEARYW